KAKKPVIYAGGGVIMGEASEELTALAHKLGYPVTNTLMGLGGFPATDELSIGMLGMHGTYEANMAMHNSDLILAVGSRFDDRATNDTSKFCPNAKVIHIDIDPATISKNITADIPIVGPVKQLLNDMIAELYYSSVRPHSKAICSWWDE